MGWWHSLFSCSSQEQAEYIDALVYFLFNRLLKIKMGPDKKVKSVNIECIICSCAYPSSQDLRRSGRKEAVESKKGTELLKQFCQFLSVPEENLEDHFACSSCQALIQNALDEKKETGEVEGKVLKLQLEVLKLKRRVLKEMENLKQGMKAFLEEVKKIEDVLKGKSVNQPSGVDVFRRRVLEAVLELQSYHEDICIEKEFRGKQQQTPSHSDSGTFQENAVLKKDTMEAVDYCDYSTKRVPDCDEESMNSMDGDDAFEPEIDSSSDSEISESEESNQPLPDVKPKISGDKPPSKKHRKRTMRNIRSVIEVDSFHGVSFEGMSYLKKYFIYQALKAQPRESKLTEEEKTDYQTKKERGDVNYYDRSTEVISIAGVHLTFNEAERAVNCSSCSFSTSGPDNKSVTKLRPAMALRLEFSVCRKLEADIRRHIRQQHLEPLQLKCKLCDSAKVFTSDSSFRTHMRKVHSTLQCDICGKSMKRNAGTLAGHKWLHMNAEEQAEALRNGVKHPFRHRSDFKDKETGVSLCCSTCGKAFATRSGLKKHEIKHLERVFVVCPVCGKKMLKESYDIHHKKYTCPLPELSGPTEGITPSGEQYRFQCLQCPLTFKAKRHLILHEKRKHSVEGIQRPFLCQECGKGYKAQGDLQMHMRIHRKDRPWKCRKGCGRDFNVERNQKRHEVTCKGRPSKTKKMMKDPLESEESN